MATLFVRAFLPEGSEDCLPDRLTISQLAQLRASSDGGLDHALFSRLMKDMETKRDRGSLAVEDRIEEELTFVGWFEWVPAKDWWGKEIEPPVLERTQRISGPTSGCERVEEIKETIHRDWVTREAARALMVLDPNHWGIGAVHWLRVAATVVSDGVAGNLLLDPGADGDVLLKKAAMIEVLVKEEGFTGETVKPKLDHPSDNNEEGQFLHGCQEGHKWWREKTRRAFVSRSGLAHDKPKTRPQV